MFKKLSLVIITALYCTPCFSSQGEKQNPQQPQRVVIPPRGFNSNSDSLDDEIVPYGTILPGDEEENPSCCDCFGPFLIGCCAVIYCGLIEHMENENKLNKLNKLE